MANALVYVGKKKGGCKIPHSCSFIEGNQVVLSASVHVQFGYHLVGLNSNHDLCYVSTEFYFRSI